MKNPLSFLILAFSLLCSFNLLAQWESIGSGFSTGQSGQREVFSISVVNESTIWATPVTNDFTQTYDFIKTEDGGISWQEGSLPDTIGAYFPGNIFALDANTAWVTMISLPGQDLIKIFKTVDGGLSWVEQNGEFNSPGFAFATLHFFNENEGLGFGSPGTGIQSIDSLQIFRTTDGGENWNRVPPASLPSPLAGEGVWVYSGNSSYEVQGDSIWFVTRASRVFRSIDKGASWDAFNAGISGSASAPGLSSIAFENASNGIVVTFQPSRAARTTDGGATWETIEIPASLSLGAIEHIPGTTDTYLINDGFAGSSNMLLTTDGGITWETLTHPPSMNCMQFISPTVGFGGGAINPANDLGMYMWTGNLSDSPTTNTLEAQPTPTLALYPNPAKESITVEMTENIMSANSIIAEVLSVDGRLIQTTTYAAQLNRLEIPVSRLKSGLYLLRLKTEEGTLAVKRFTKT